MSDSNGLEEKVADLQEKVEQVVQDIPAALERSKLFEYSRKLLLATIGAVALAQDEVETLVAKLVDRGEIAERDGKELAKKLSEKGLEMAEKSKSRLTRRKTTAEKHDADKPAAPASDDLPVATDFQSLVNKVASLAEKVEAMNRKINNQQ